MRLIYSEKSIYRWHGGTDTCICKVDIDVYEFVEYPNFSTFKYFFLPQIPKDKSLLSYKV